LGDVDVDVAPWRPGGSNAIRRLDLPIDFERHRLQDLSIEADTVTGNIELVQRFLRDRRIGSPNFAPYLGPKVESEFLSILQGGASPMQLQLVSFFSAPLFPASWFLLFFACLLGSGVTCEARRDMAHELSARGILPCRHSRAPERYCQACNERETSAPSNGRR